ncbi:hypothetical protein LUX12_05450 [Streptomyces somaliensis]|uniref:hypothetical protein n=1 Tax=Streptomyces somaliensis TaxID=78355 RepID=UPI0020CB9909|nr:hypothetical protein [Streptomyces somaliensis]MCP9944361.1 hypothetical protein [Streptomyces somaliensis]MCP9962404.1 hypothetical protein [Streptomyces somaliensis]MCP9975223.1 hypothetical protein [Streptomyces somaliensis]
MHAHDAPSPQAVAADAPHRTSIVERGAFALAHCVCGWYGPARRSRERARADAAAHESERGRPVRG